MKIPAQLHLKGKLKIGEPFVNESYTGSKFTGEILKTTKVGKFSAIIPSIEGWTVITGYNTIFWMMRIFLWRGFKCCRQLICD